MILEDLSLVALVPLSLLSVAGLIGSVDLLYFHLWKFRLYRQPTARWEQVTHLARNALMVTGVILLLSGVPAGALFWLVAALFVGDFINSVVDVLLEPKSRAPLGGVPPLEYLVHIVGSSLAGATAASFMLLGWSLRNESTALLPHALPGFVELNGWLLVGGGTALFLVEAGLFLGSLLGWRCWPCHPSARLSCC